MNNEVASALRGLYTKFGDQILAQPPRLASLYAMSARSADRKYRRW